MDICDGNIMEHMGHSLFESYTSVMVVFELLLLLVDRLLAFGDEVLNNDSLEKNEINNYKCSYLSYYVVPLDNDSKHDLELLLPCFSVTLVLFIIDFARRYSNPCACVLL